MDTTERKTQKTPEQKHQKQFMLEIILPLAIAILLFAGLAVLSVCLTGTNGTLVAQWADISIILMIIPLLFVCLFSLIIVFLIDWGLIRWMKSFPAFFIKLRTSVNKIAATIQYFAATLASPMINIKSTIAAIHQFFNQIFPNHK